MLIALAVWVADYLFSQTSIPILKVWNHAPGTWFNLLTVLAVYTLTWLAIWVAKARRRLVVEEFVNYAGKELEQAVAGMANLLTTKLAHLHDLYSVVDEQRAIPTAAWTSESLDATISVDDVEAFLKDAVTSQSKLSLGPLEIPVGVLMSLVGRFVQGPRILGSLHKDKDHLMLTAQSNKKGAAFSWRVEYTLTPEEVAQARPVDLSKLVDELSYRVFTDLTMRSTFRWRAAASFSKGLREYRDCLRTPKNRINGLKHAEERFVETLTEDIKFSLAYYNLGVVLTELGRKDAAISAFEQAMIEDPKSWNAYYALALSCFENGEYYRTFHLCRRVTDRKKVGKANIAKAYHLKAQAKLAMEEKRGPVQSAACYDDAIQNCEKALKYARRALYWAEITQQDSAAAGNDKVLKLETLVGLCISNLAKMYNKQAKRSGEKAKRSYFAQVEQLFWGAFDLRSTDATYEALSHVQLSETYYLQQKYTKATRQLRIAVRAAPDRVDYWAKLALNHALALQANEADESKELPDEDYEDFIFETIIDFASDKAEIFAPARKETSEAYAILTKLNIHHQGKCERIKAIAEFLDLGNKVDDLLRQANVAQSFATLEDMCKTYERQEVLHFFQVAFGLGRVYAHSGQQQQLNALMQKLVTMEEEFTRADRPGQEWELGQLRRILATLYHQAGECEQEARGKLDPEIQRNSEQAAKYYEAAIAVLAKKHPREISIQHLRSSLATVFLQLPGKRQAALQVAQEAIQLDALNHNNYEILGDVYFGCGDFERAIMAWKDAIQHKNTLTVQPYGPELHIKIGKAYVKLAQSHHGRCFKEEESQEAISFMLQALACCGDEHALPRLKVCHALGYFYCERGEYEMALNYLRQAQSFDYAPCTSTFYLAYSHLRNVEYAAALQQFAWLQTLLEKVHGQPEDIVERDTVGHIPLAEMQALALWGQAIIYTERGVNLPGALRLAEDALQLVGPLQKSPHLQFPGRYAHCKGYILYKIGDAEHDPVQIEQAITFLKQAVELEAQAEFYLHLALACESKLSAAKDELQVQQLIACIRSHCKHVHALDTGGPFSQQADELLKRLPT